MINVTFILKNSNSDFLNQQELQLKSDEKFAVYCII